MEFRNIHILGYPTNKASSGGFSSRTPVAFEKVIHSHIAGKYGVQQKFEMVKVVDKDSPRKNKINNFDSVYQSVLNLSLELINVMWRGGVPITIGGDHAQGFPTVKASLFVTVLKELLLEGAKSISQISKLKINALADKGDFISVAAMLEGLIKESKDLKYKVESIINKVHIIWVDAHGDFNTANTSDSGNFHGMSLAAACGLDTGGIEDMLGKYIRANPGNIHIMCARDLDEREEKLMNLFGVDFERFEMHDTEKGKIRTKVHGKNSKAKTFDKVFIELVNEIKGQGGKIILSTDIDHLPLPETGTPLGNTEHERKNRFGKSPEGPSPEDTYEAFENIAQDETFISFDITEVALGYTDKNGKFKFGLKACVAGVNILASMLGGKKARKETLTSIRKQGKFREKLKAIAVD